MLTLQRLSNPMPADSLLLSTVQQQLGVVLSFTGRWRIWARNTPLLLLVTTCFSEMYS